MGATVLLGAALVLAVAGCGGSSHAAWHLQSIPAPRAFNEELSSVSCSSERACTAVGSLNAGVRGYRTLAERWNGTNWTVESTPSPSELNYLYSVSCASEMSCAAVGRAGNALLYARWNGSVWSAQRVALARHRQLATFPRLVCQSPAECTVLFSYSTQSASSVAVTQRVTAAGTSTVYGGPARVYCAGASCINSLYGIVSCAPAACVLLRMLEPSGTEIAERWDPRVASGFQHATVEHLAHPSGVRWLELSAVSCPSDAECVATGEYERTGSIARWAAAQRWDGHSWSAEAVPVPRGARSSALTGLSCPATNRCMAVGHFTNSADVELTFSARLY